MAGILNIPKFVDYRNKVKRHSTKKFPVLNLKNKTTIAIHHSLTKQGLGGSNAEAYARYHVDTLGWPSIGYSYVIEPDGTIKFCNDIELRTYHVGDHNNYAVGIVLTGDFRYEEPTEAQKESLRNLVSALKEKYPHLKHVKGHSEFSGYEWKACPVFDYKAVLAEKKKPTEPVSLPNTHTIQEGDTLWSIAKGINGLTVDDLLKANPDVEPTKLRIGQKIKLGSAMKTTPEKPASKPVAKPTPSKETSSEKLKAGQKVQLKATAKTYATGQTIPSYIKNKTYTIQQVKSDRVLLNEIYSWVYIKDLAGNSASTPKKTTKPAIKVGGKVKIKVAAKKYATGENIPSHVKNKTYTIQQVKGNRVLLKEIYSWVNVSDLQ